MVMVSTEILTFSPGLVPFFFLSRPSNRSVLMATDRDAFKTAYVYLPQFVGVNL